MNPEALTCPPPAACGVGAWRGPSSVRQLGPAGKAHLRRALLGQEAALQLHAVCRALRWEDLLQAVLARALQRSLAKYSELDLEDDFHEATEAPDVQREHQSPGWVCLGPSGGGRQRLHVPHREPSEEEPSHDGSSPLLRACPIPPGTSDARTTMRLLLVVPRGPECMAAPQATTLGP